MVCEVPHHGSGPPRAWAPTAPGPLLLPEIQLDASGGGEGVEGALKSICLSWPRPGALEKGLTPPLPLLPVASTSASAGPPSIRTVAHSFTIPLCRLEKGRDFQATRMGVLALGQPSFLAHHPLPKRPHPGLSFLYGRQSANSQRREVGQSLRPREERLFTASGSSWLQRSGGLASQ